MLYSIIFTFYDIDLILFTRKFLAIKRIVLDNFIFCTFLSRYDRQKYVIIFIRNRLLQVEATKMTKIHCLKLCITRRNCAIVGHYYYYLCI